MMKNKPIGSIAIVGYSHRLPGEDRGDFWDLLLRGEDLVTEVAEDRWAKETYLHPNKSEPGRAYTFASGSVGDIFGFDAAFFGISTREAAQMDPQQRLLLELTWEAFEKAGIRPSSWRGSDAAVYVGISTTDNVYLSVDDLAMIDSTSATGNTNSIASNRISYLFDLRGPSMSVDTACSSSLVAFHQACQAIRSGESGAAIVAGISLHLHPMGFINFSKTSMLSPKGRCTPFDEGGEGYARSEGSGVILLKSLDQALKDGDQVLAVVAGSGVNCDGKTSSLTVPSADAQAKLLEEVYAKAGIAPEEVSYVEAHGTGTQVGDPIETSALARVLGKHRSDGNPLPIGSVKSNIGHLEAASGIAGLVKALLVLKNRVIPPTIHLKKVNPKIPLQEWGLAVPTVPMSLPPKGRLIVGVNSFGFGGANAHVILESSPALKKVPAAKSRRRPVVNSEHAPLFLSARSDEALRESARRYRDLLMESPEVSPYDLAYAISHRREWLPKRLTVSGETCGLMAGALENWLVCGEDVSVVEGEAMESPDLPVFVFSGNGSQHSGMARALLGESETFRAAVAEVDALFSKFADYSLIEVIADPQKESMLRLTEVAQPALFAIQAGIVRLLAEKGIRPRAVIGHSVGEVAAAWAAGILSLEQSVHLIHERSLQQGRTRGSGEMTAVAMGRGDLEELLATMDGTLRPVIAGLNSPDSSTLAGEPEALVLCEELLRGMGVRFKRLDLDYAFHSPAMDPIRGDLLRHLADLSPVEGLLPFYSSVSGNLLKGGELGADYWWRNVREPVLFGEAVGQLIDHGARLFVEVGPHPVLRTYLHECLKKSGHQGVLAAPLARTKDSLSDVERAVFQIVQAGSSEGRDRYFPKPPLAQVDLPTYPWQKTRFETPSTGEAYRLSRRHLEHPLLGCRLKEERFGWEHHLDTTLHPYLADHRVGGATVFPAAGFVELLLAAGSLRYGNSAVDLEDLEIRSPLLLDEKRSKTVRVILREEDGIASVLSRDRLSDEPWMTHVVARILPSSSDDSCVIDRESIDPKTQSLGLSAKDLYKSASLLGLEYGDSFQAVSGLVIQGPSIKGALRTPENLVEVLSQYLIHPTYLDGALQSLLGFLALEQDETKDRRAFLPVRFERLRLHSAGKIPVSLRATVRRRTRRGILADLSLSDASGHLVLSATGVRFKEAKLITRSADHARHLGVVFVPRPLTGLGVESALPLSILKQSMEDAMRRIETSITHRRPWDESEPLMDLLCGSLVRECLEKLSDEKGFLNPQSLVQQGRVSAEHQPYLFSLIRMMEEDKVIRQSEGDRYHWIQNPDQLSSQSLWITLIEDYPEAAEIVRVIGRVGNHLGEILSGGMAVEDLLPRDWVAESLFLAPGSQDIAGMLLRETLEGMSSKGEITRRPRILWMLGERIRGVPLPIQRNLTEHYEIVFSVPSQLAKKDLLARLGDYPMVAVHCFDRQGMMPDYDMMGGRFDLVMVACGISLDSGMPSLEEISSLLLPKGTVAMPGRMSNRVDGFLFGSRSGWWMQKGSQLIEAQRSPIAGWKSLFAKAGLLNAEAVVPGGMKIGSCFLITASAPDDSIINKKVSPGSWLMAFEEEEAASLLLSLHDGMEQCGSACLMTPLQIEADQFADCVEEGSFAGLLIAVGFRKRVSAVESSISDLQRRLIQVNLLLKANAALEFPLPVTVLSTGLFDCSRAGACLSKQPEITEIGAALLGFLRVARNEYAPIPLRVLDVKSEDLSTMGDVLINEIMDEDREDEVVIGQTGQWVPRVIPMTIPGQYSTGEESHHLDFSQPGSFSHLTWSSAKRTMPNRGELEISVRAAGLNFRDVMYAMGLLPDEALESGFAGQTLGMELSGVVTRIGVDVDEFQVGDEVIAFAPRAFGTHTVTRREAVMSKPKEWSFEAAATIPTTFFTVYYSLVELARVRPGEKILIHGAAGGVGIAAIQLARHLGLEIFASAGSAEKREFVSMLGADHVLDSRSLRFADDVLALTDGAGVDVILNSLAGEAVPRNLRILQPFGRFLELGKRDFYENSRIGLRPFRNNITYYGIDADQLMAVNPSLTGKLFSKLRQLFADGILKPIPFTVFDSTEIAEAFRFMQHSRQVGKVVVTLPGSHISDAASSELGILPGKRCPRIGEGTYLVTGGTSGFGLRTAAWLAQRGAESVVIASRRGVLDDEGRGIVEEMARRGTSVRIASCDVSSRESLAALLAEIRSSGMPLRGVVHSAMTIDDGMLQYLSEDQLAKVLSPKLQGAMLLDELTRIDQLDLFVLYSSATTVFGNPGQAAYVAANMGLEALAARRASLGLPVACPAWGPIADAGYLSRNEKIKDALGARMGGRALDSEDALATLNAMLNTGMVVSSWLDLDWSRLSKFLPTAVAPRFESLRHHAEETSAVGHDAGSIREQFADLDHGPTVSLLKDHLKKAVSSILRTDPEKIDERRSLFEAGMDSLMAVELAASLEETLEIKLPMMALSEGPTIQKLAERIASMIHQAENHRTEHAHAGDLEDEARIMAAQHGATELSTEDLNELASTVSQATS